MLHLRHFSLFIRLLSFLASFALVARFLLNANAKVPRRLFLARPTRRALRPTKISSIKKKVKEKFSRKQKIITIVL
jgi:hypothetical protein